MCDQKRASDCLELESLVVSSHLTWVLRTEHRPSEGAANTLNY